MLYLGLARFSGKFVFGERTMNLILLHPLVLVYVLGSEGMILAEDDPHAEQDHRHCQHSYCDHYFHTYTQNRLQR